MRGLDRMDRMIASLSASMTRSRIARFMRQSDAS